MAPVTENSYENCFSQAPVCAPSRFTLITGMYATSCGPAHHMRAQGKIAKGLRGFPAYLRDAGNYCTNNAKTDYNAPIDMKDKTLSWVNMKVPDGDDYVEFMLYSALPAPDARGTSNHMSLEVADIEKAREQLEARPYRKGCTRPIEVRTGINRKRQLNLYDPDGTRAELMEPSTVDGTPAPSSTAPPPARK